MRTLVLIYAIFTVSALTAAPASFNMNTSVTSSSGTTLINPDRTEDLSGNLLSLQANTGDTVLSFADFRIGYTRKKVDYSNYTIRSADGSTRSLGDSFDKPEHLYSVGTNLYYKSFTLGLDGQTTAGETPFKERNTTTSISYSNYGMGSNFKLGWYHRNSQRPVSVINNPDNFKAITLSERLVENEFFFEYEQILSERLKVKLSPKMNLATEDRPLAYGAELQGGYAVLDEVALLSSVSSFSESDSGDAPTTGTGFYSLQSIGGGFAYEPFYNVFLKGFYNLTVENETARGRNPEQLVGTDSYIAGITYRKRKVEANVFLQIDRSNTGAKSDALSGGLTWNL